MKSIFKKSKKERVIIRLWNSFWDKENLIEKYIFDGNLCDAIILTKSGIYLFSIFTDKGELIKYGIGDKIWIFGDDEESSILNPIESLDKIENHLKKILKDDKLPYFKCVIFSESKYSYGEYIFNINGFRKFIKGKEKILSSEEINVYTKIIKENNSKKLLSE